MFYLFYLFVCLFVCFFFFRFSHSLLAAITFQFRIEVWDKDLVGVDDSMGYADILSKDWNLTKPGVEEKRWIPVVDGEGDIQIGLTLLQEKK